jgi:hypothetical protein
MGAIRVQSRDSVSRARQYGRRESRYNYSFPRVTFSSPSHLRSPTATTTSYNNSSKFTYRSLINPMSDSDRSSSPDESISELQRKDPCLPWHPETQRIRAKIAKIRAKAIQSRPIPAVPVPNTTPAVHSPAIHVSPPRQSLPPLAPPPADNDELAPPLADDDELVFPEDQPVPPPRGNSILSKAEKRY